MTLFAPENRNKSDRHRKIWAAYELVHTSVDFGAAACFVVGSVMFFYDSLQTGGTWAFLIGSILFAAKPSLRMARELHYAAIGDDEDLAERAGG